MVLTAIQQVTPERLTTILENAGVLKHGPVNTVRVMNTGTSRVASHYELLVEYADYQDTKSAPDHLFLKISQPGFEPGQKEVLFYNAVVPPMREQYAPQDLPFVPCYDALYDPESQRSHLILRNLTKPYFVQKDPVPPTIKHTHRLIDMLARIHAFWWEHPRLTDTLGTCHTDESIDAALALYQSSYQEMADVMGDRLYMRHRQLFSKVAQMLPPRRREHMLSGKNMTIIHTHLHEGNIMHSHDDTYILDWQSWRIDAGTDDLAYLIACRWPRETREKQEIDLLRRYHALLLKLGVRDYSWEDLWYDYRASIARALGDLMVRWTPQKSIGPYQGLLDRGVFAFFQHEGMAVFEG